MRGYRILAIDVIKSMDLMRYYKLFSSTPLLTSYSSCEHQSASTLQASPKCPRPWKKSTPENENRISTPTRSSETRVHTSSPTSITLPPQPGSSTRSPAFTAVGTTLPYPARQGRNHGFREAVRRRRSREEDSRCHFLFDYPGTKVGVGRALPKNARFRV